MKVHCTAIFVVLILFIQCSSAVFIPTNLECGEASDVKSVTFPHSIPSTYDKTTLIQSAFTWANPKPITNLTILTDGQIVGYVLETYQLMEEVNASNPNQMFNSFSVQSVAYDASATQISDCGGFYLRANLSNGAHVEYSWYSVYVDTTIEFAGTSHNLTAGQSVLYYFMSNFPYESNASAPTIKYTSQVSSHFPPIAAWEGTYGVFPFLGENNAATSSAEIIPAVDKTKHGYLIKSIVLNQTTPYTSEKNGEAAGNTKIRGLANQINDDLQILSIDSLEVYIGPFTVNDTVRNMRIITYGVGLEEGSIGGADGDGSSASVLIFPSVKMILLSLVIFVGVFYL
eukprot:TRINITY_DN1887_c0_g1_i1.p1 TRINITY_DN1887_c0_g1~~TRINITY_DN1887_c0_g1_i1.p1  ORF type:complete len:343 (-),score=52.61 TRINITY_DN1887_c0_g1_i1:55-1083(-)